MILKFNFAFNWRTTQNGPSQIRYFSLSCRTFNFLSDHVIGDIVSHHFHLLFEGQRNVSVSTVQEWRKIRHGEANNNNFETGCEVKKVKGKCHSSARIVDSNNNSQEIAKIFSNMKIYIQLLSQMI